MKNGRLLCFIVLIISCNQHTQEIHGTYKSYRRNLIEQVWLKINNSWYSVGGTMQLKEDSTFTYTTCGNIQKGSWLCASTLPVQKVKSILIMS